ncbi:MAG TPA: heme exporter protein CcmD [Methylovirgula sp.]
MNSPYFGYIFAAYAVGFTVIALMIAATLIDYRSLKDRLARLTARTGRSIDD